MKNYVTKTINFYKFDFKKGDDSAILDEILIYLDGLEYSEDKRYLPIDDDNYLSVLINSKEEPYKLQLAYVRKGGLPHYEENSPPQPLQLPNNGGLYEPTHMVFFKEGFVGVEYNHFGPRISRLSQYFPKKCPSLIEFASFYPLLDNNIYNQIERMGEISSFQIKIQKDIIQMSKDLDDNLFDSLRALGELNNQIQELEIIIRPRRKGHLNIRGMIFKMPEWLKNSHVKDGVSKIKVRAKDLPSGDYRTFDLLQE